jgi:hypothetical protein
MKIRNNDLTHYFLRPHNQLPQGYLDHCQEFFNSLKRQASSGKLQAASFKRLTASGPGDTNRIIKEK